MWDTNNSKEIVIPENIKLFLNDIRQVCEKHKLSISHEDGHGSFIIEKFNDVNLVWLFNASTNIIPKQ